MLKKTLESTFYGLGFGSFAYLMVLLFGIQPTRPTPTNILSILLMSACIGLLSQIFDLDSVNFIVALTIHFVGTMMFVTILCRINQWPLSAEVIWITLSIYLAVWIVMIIQQSLQVKTANRLIRQRQKR